MKKSWRKYKNKLKHHFEEVLKTHSTPHEIGLGFAIGSFLAILPTPGLSVLLGALFALIYEKVSKYSLFAAFVVWNPIAQSFLYVISYQIGNALLGPAPPIRYDVGFLGFVYDFSRRFLVGNVILGIFFAVMGYFALKKAVIIYRARSSASQ